MQSLLHLGMSGRYTWSRSCKRNSQRHGRRGIRGGALVTSHRNGSRRDGGDLKNQTVERQKPKPSEDQESRSFG